MYWLSCSKGSTASLVVTSCIESFGTSVLASAFEITVDMALKDSVDSFPPTVHQLHVEEVNNSLCIPLRMAALPDLIASDAMLAITSGRASKMIRSTPIGHDWR